MRQSDQGRLLAMIRVISLFAIAVFAAATAFAQPTDNALCRSAMLARPDTHLVLMVKGQDRFVDCGKIAGQAVDRLVFVSMADLPST